MEEPQSDFDLSNDRSLQTAESLRVLREQADQTLGEHRERVGEIETRLNAQLELLAEELASERLADEQTLAASAADSVERTELLEQLQKTIAEKEAEVEEVLEQLATQSLAFDALIAERDEELEQVLELGEEESQQRESLEQEKGSLEQELAASQQALEDLQAQENGESSQARKELTEIQEQFQQLDERFSTLQEEHKSQQTELEEARQASEASQQQSEETATSLLEAEQQVAELSQSQQENEKSAEQLKQLDRKFELALADVHKLKRENAELHEELLSRPEADDQESPELVSLRAERDALSERVLEFENAPAPTASDDDQQALDDLQRRFELAVDDVRQLKQENADMQQRLEAAPAASPASSDDEPQDWQAQRARLMATLDAEDQGLVDEVRSEERATIEGTISITDRVVAEKDAMLTEWEAEVADLQSKLKKRPEGQDVEALREQITAAIFGEEEAVQAECARLRQQQEQLDEKLREAELEISVRRATLAREEVALEEKIAALPSEDSEAEKTSTGKPRRRWLSALGIGDEDES